MSNNKPRTTAEPTQTEVDVHHLVAAIENNIGDDLVLPGAGRTRIVAALHAVLSRRDEETARLETALGHARSGLIQAEMVVSDEYSRGGGSDLPPWDGETATGHLVEAQRLVSDVLRGA
ncbi:hypothetical protein [Actinosynnema sp. NPDC023587]|uniref:hypothetical protein n=1 Tax=Actinosynnema sp. NPDC023587 TaxID=3154695 RepID=UPI0033CA3F48